MARTYSGIGQVVYGKFKDLVIFTNEAKTYLIVGSGGDKYTDPVIEEVVSPDSVSNYKLITQKEANANQSGVFTATYWFGIGAGILASQMGKHTEYTVELTFTTGEKSHVVLINEGYQILIGSLSIGDPEMQAAQAKMSRLKAKRNSIEKALRYQISQLEKCYADLSIIPSTSDYANGLRHQIETRLDVLKKNLSNINSANADTLNSLSAFSGNDIDRLVKEKTILLNAFEQYSTEYENELSSLNKAQNEESKVEQTILDSKEGTVKKHLDTAKACFIAFIIFVGIEIFLLTDGSGIAIFGCICGLLPIILTLSAAINSLKTANATKKTITSEEKQIIAEKKKEQIEAQNKVEKINSSIPQFDTWYNNNKEKFN